MVKCSRDSLPEIPEQLYLTKHPYRQYDTGPKSSKGIYGKKGDHMPSETFFRLPESKQQRIIEAIKEEIARVPYENFSIGNIIRHCSISRGSFYQYFKNKEEIYLYLISGYQDLFLRFALETLEKNGGDFFDMLEVTFRYAVRMLCYKDSKAFRHNLFCNMRLCEQIWQKDDSSAQNQFEIERFRASVDKSKLRLDSEEEFNILFDICMINALKDAAGIFIADDNEQKVLDNFQRKLTLLKKAYSK